jgi:hypothetical protein
VKIKEFRWHAMLLPEWRGLRCQAMLAAELPQTTSASVQSRIPVNQIAPSTKSPNSASSILRLE